MFGRSNRTKWECPRKFLLSAYPHPKCTLTRCLPYLFVTLAQNALEAYVHSYSRCTLLLNALLTLNELKPYVHSYPESNQSATLQQVHTYLKYTLMLYESYSNLDQIVFGQIP